MTPILLLCAGDDILRYIADCLGTRHSGALAGTCQRAREVIRRHHCCLRLDTGVHVQTALWEACNWAVGPRWLCVTLSPALYHGVFRSVFAQCVRSLGSIEELQLCFTAGPRRRSIHPPQPLRLPAGLRTLIVRNAPPTFDVALSDVNAGHLEVVDLHGRLLDDPHRGPVPDPPRQWLRDLAGLHRLCRLSITQTESGPRRSNGRVNTLVPASPLTAVSADAPLVHVRLALLDDIMHGLRGLPPLADRLRRLELSLNDQVHPVLQYGWMSLALTLQQFAFLQELVLSLSPGWSHCEDMVITLLRRAPPRLKQLVVTAQPWAAPDGEIWRVDDPTVAASTDGLHTLVAPFTTALVLPKTVTRLAWGDAGTGIDVPPVVPGIQMFVEAGWWRASKSWLVTVLPQLTALTVCDHPHHAPAMGLTLAALRRCRQPLRNLRSLRLWSRTAPSAMTRLVLPLHLWHITPNLERLSLALTLPARLVAVWKDNVEINAVL